MRFVIATNAKIVRQGLEHLRKAIPEIGRKRLYDMARAIKKILRKPGKKPTYPIQWDSEKQRRAFFARDGFSKPAGWKRPKGYVNQNIPTRRTNAYVKGFKVERLESGYSIVNPVTYAGYVGGRMSGKGQSKIHKDRWQIIREVVNREVAKLPKLIIESLRSVISRFAK